MLTNILDMGLPKKSENLSDIVNYLMRIKNKTPIIIEKETGLNQNTIYSITAGKNHNPSLSTLKLLALGLEVGVERFITNDYSDEEDEKLSFDKMRAFVDTASATIQKLEEMNKNITMHQMLKLINDFYEYSIGVEPPSVDTRYINHMLEKKFSDKN